MYSTTVTTKPTTARNKEVLSVIRRANHVSNRVYGDWIPLFQEEFEIDDVCELIAVATGLVTSVESKEGYLVSAPGAFKRLDNAWKAVKGKNAFRPDGRKNNSQHLIFLLILLTKDRAILDLDDDRLRKLLRYALVAPRLMTSLDAICQYADADVDLELIRSMR
jgi:hypothetical protein